MKKLIILLACITPLVIGFFQNKRYEGKLKGQLTSEAEKVLAKYNVSNPSIELDKLDAELSGIAANEEDRRKIAEEVTEIGGPGAVRVTDANNKLLVYGDVEVQKVGDTLTVDGNLSAPADAVASVKSQTEGGTGHALSVKEGEVHKKAFYKDPAVLATPAFAAWAQSYFSLGGDRGLKVSAKDNTLILNGKLTEKLKKRVIASAEKAGLKIDPQFELIEPTPAELIVNRKEGQFEVKGNLPDDYNLSRLKGLPNTDKIALDPYTDAVKGVNSEGFGNWIGSYFTPSGDRGFSLTHDKIGLRGIATPFLKNDWFSALKGLGLSPMAKMKLFPSEYHFPAYKVESKLAESELKALQKGLSLNEIFFDIGSSLVKEGEMLKVDALQAAIVAAGGKAKFVIGGHADSTGNVQANLKLSKKRAEAVLAALNERGITSDLFSLVSFGSSKSKTEGSNQNDRRVEILVK